jgi:hypothetical protein
MPRDVISPELALVSPELAQAARLRLRDRPWEATPRQKPVSAPHPVGVAPAPGRSRSVSRRSAGSEGAAVPLPPVAGQTEQIRELATRALAVAGTDRHARRPRRLLLALAAILGVLTVVIVGAFWERGGNQALTPTRPGAVEAPDQISATTTMPLLASAGYVVSPDGGFLTGRSGQVIQSFTLPIRCGSRQLVVRGIPVRGRLLRFTGKAVGQAVTVRLQGRIIDRKHVRGVVVARGKTCSAARVGFSARLS